MRHRVCCAVLPVVSCGNRHWICCPRVFAMRQRRSLHPRNRDQPSRATLAAGGCVRDRARETLERVPPTGFARRTLSSAVQPHPALRPQWTRGHTLRPTAAHPGGSRRATGWVGHAGPVKRCCGGGGGGSASASPHLPTMGVTSSMLLGREYVPG